MLASTDQHPMQLAAVKNTLLTFQRIQKRNHQLQEENRLMKQQLSDERKASQQNKEWAEDLNEENKTLRKTLRATARYLQDSENDNDALRQDNEALKASLEAERQARAMDAAKANAIPEGVEGDLLRRRAQLAMDQDVELVDAEVVSNGEEIEEGKDGGESELPRTARVMMNPVVADMDWETLVAECAERGLPQHGSEDELRGRLWAAMTMKAYK